MRFAIAVAVVLLSTCSALAAEGHSEGHHEEHYTLEVSGGTTAGLVLTTGSESKSTWIVDAEVAVPVYGELLDVALDVSLDSSNRLTAERRTDVTTVGGLQINLGDSNPRDSFFLFGGAGFTLASEAGHTETEFTYRFRGGKRFSLTNSVCYAPFVRYTKINTMDGEFAIVPFGFALFL